MSDYIEDRLDISLPEVIRITNVSLLRDTTYWGVKAIKSPNDAWVYQEIIYETKPDVIIEIGTYGGGGTLFLAHLCDLLGKGRVIGLDLSHEIVPDSVRNHPRITLMEGDACQRLPDVLKLIAINDRVLVIEDSSHSYENTLNVLRAYSGLIKPGDYFIVEDSIINHGLHLDGHELAKDPGPYKAIETFIDENKGFEIDRGREHFFITWNPKGFLKRISMDENYSNSSITATIVRARYFDRRLLLRAIRLFTPPILIHMARKLSRLLK